MPLSQNSAKCTVVSLVGTRCLLQVLISLFLFLTTSKKSESKLNVFFFLWWCRRNQLKRLFVEPWLSTSGKQKGPNVERSNMLRKQNSCGSKAPLSRCQQLKPCQYASKDPVWCSNARDTTEPGNLLLLFSPILPTCIFFLAPLTLTTSYVVKIKPAALLCCATHMKAKNSVKDKGSSYQFYTEKQPTLGKKDKEDCKGGQRNDRELTWQNFQAVLYYLMPIFCWQTDIGEENCSNLGCKSCIYLMTM